MRSLYTTCMFSTASAFVVGPHQALSSLGCRRNRVVLHSDLAFNPEEGFRSVDISRAKHCAEHFGVCSVKEMEDLRTNLHKERMQSFVYGGGHGVAEMSPEALEHLVLEEELELQLNLISDIMPKPTLFPEVEEEMAELPHLKDNTASHKIEDAVHRVENMASATETVLEESTLETLAMCAVILAMAMLPSFMN